MNADALRQQADFLARAVKRLFIARSQPKNEFTRDSAIQRFEFTFEFTGKVIERYLAAQGLETRSPRAAIRGAFEQEPIADDSDWLAMIELSNLTSHAYDEKIAERIYGELPETLRRFQDLLTRLGQEITKA